jgi:hypothetical protein
VNGKRTVWVVVGGASLLTGYRAITRGFDPIPQLAGIGASGVILLFLAEPFPKFAASIAVMLGATLALNWDFAEQRATPQPTTNPVTIVTGPR